MFALLILMTGFILGTACSNSRSPQERAETLAGACLKMVRLEQQALEPGTGQNSGLALADSLFLQALQIDPQCVGEFVQSGGGACQKQIGDFLTAAGALEPPRKKDDPAEAIISVLTDAAETSPKKLFPIQGYAAAFQMCMEIERDGTVLQDFIPFLLAAGCPMTFKDLGLASSSRSRLEELAAQASVRTGKMPYSTGTFDYFITLVKIDSWASKFSGQVTADTLAARLMLRGEFKPLIPRLQSLPPTRLGFLGDSYMDPIHWSTQAPFPEIIAAVFRRLDPEVKVVNAGKGGDDSGEALARIEKDLVEKKPDISFVMLGSNDCRHWGRPGPAVTPETYRENISKIVDLLGKVPGRVVLMAPPHAPNLEGADLEVFVDINRQLVSAKDSLGTGWLDLGGIIAAQHNDRGLFAVDGDHLGPEAHLLIAEKILEWLSQKM